MVKFCECIILLFFSINIINANNSTNSTNSTNSKYVSKCENAIASEVKECKDKLLDEEKELNYRCCLFKGTKDGVQKHFCDLLLEEETTDDYIFDMKQNGYTEASMECKSFYLHLSILFLILIVL